MKRRYLSFTAFAFAALLCRSAAAQTVRFQTNMGNIDVVLLPESAPLTVANFLNYVNRGAYDNSFFHRSVPGFIVQGGGFTFGSGGVRSSGPRYAHTMPPSSTVGYAVRRIFSLWRLSGGSFIMSTHFPDTSNFQPW